MTAVLSVLASWLLLSVAYVLGATVSRRRLADDIANVTHEADRLQIERLELDRDRSELRRRQRAHFDRVAAHVVREAEREAQIQWAGPHARKTGWLS